MDKLLNSIKCHHCNETLKTPILLPCGHSMCKVHAEEAEDQVKCAKCGMVHENQEFVIILDFLEMIENSQIASLDFGPFYKKAKYACDKLEEVLDRIDPESINLDQMIKDPIYFSHMAIDELKNRVLLKREQLKLEIDENAEKLLAMLTDYQKKCERNLKDPILVSSLKNFENIKIETEKMLKESLDFLNQLKVDHEKWISITQACESKVVAINEEFEYLKKLILMNEFEEKRETVDFFVNVDLYPLFQMKYLFFIFDIFEILLLLLFSYYFQSIQMINSAILDGEQKTKLLEMCKINPYTKWTRLWRGSRDGFGAEDFHSKCDNIPNTVTVIKTTQGYVFGGYTEQIWNPLSGFCYREDPNAFIFSLVNSRNFPFMIKVKDPGHSIFASQLCGPTFGSHDIIINDNCNTVDNSSRIYSYHRPVNFSNYPNILSKSENFQVKEIEVFHLG